MQSVRLKSVYRDRQVSIAVVESVRVDEWRAHTTCQLTGELVPVTVVLQDPDGICAFDLQGRAISLEDLLKRHPDLAASLPGQIGSTP